MDTCTMVLMEKKSEACYIYKQGIISILIGHVMKYNVWTMLLYFSTQIMKNKHKLYLLWTGL